MLPLLQTTLHDRSTVASCKRAGNAHVTDRSAREFGRFRAIHGKGANISHHGDQVQSPSQSVRLSARLCIAAAGSGTTDQYRPDAHCPVAGGGWHDVAGGLSRPRAVHPALVPHAGDAQRRADHECAGTAGPAATPDVAVGLCRPAALSAPALAGTGLRTDRAGHHLAGARSAGQRLAEPGHRHHRDPDGTRRHRWTAPAAGLDAAGAAWSA